MLSQRLRAILDDMLAYEAERFDAEPIGYQSGGFGEAIYDTREEAETACRLSGFRPDTVEPVYGELNVSGADLVDAFTEWREQLKAALAVETANGPWTYPDLGSIRPGDRVIVRRVKNIGGGPVHSMVRGEVMETFATGTISLRMDDGRYTGWKAGDSIEREAR